MAGTIVNLIFLFVQSASALSPAHRSAIDHVLNERLASNQVMAKVRDLKAKVDAAEERMLPIAFKINRLGPLLGQRSTELDSINEFVKNKSNIINPYGDRNWVQSARKETAYVCCEVRRNSRLAQEIQENLAAGLPALSESTSDKVGDRAHTAAIKNEIVIEVPAGEASANGDLIMGGVRIRQGKNSGGGGGGSGGGLISGLPSPSGPGPQEQAQQQQQQQQMDLMNQLQKMMPPGATPPGGFSPGVGGAPGAGGLMVPPAGGGDPASGINQ